jgi:hypothetical protein
MSKGDAKREVIYCRYQSSEHGDFEKDPDVEDYLRRMLAHRIKDELDRELGSSGVFSLSARWDSVLMWSHYADYHRGLCIEFDTTELPHPGLQPVNYRADRSIRASDLLAWKDQSCADAKERILHTYFYSKATPWCYEKEWRDLSGTNGIVSLAFRVTAIYFGLRCDRAVIHSVAKLLSLDQDVALYEIYPLDATFRLRRRLVDRYEIEAQGLRTPAAIAFKDTFLPGSDN